MSFTMMPNCSWTKTSSRSKLIESRMPVSSSGVAFPQRQEGPVPDDFPADVVVNDRFQLSNFPVA